MFSAQLFVLLPFWAFHAFLKFLEEETDQQPMIILESTIR